MLEEKSQHSEIVVESPSEEKLIPPVDTPEGLQNLASATGQMIDQNTARAAVE